MGPAATAWLNASSPGCPFDSEGGSLTAPRTSPTRVWDSPRRRSPAARKLPTLRADAISPPPLGPALPLAPPPPPTSPPSVASPRASSTASPAAHETGLPPKVLKYSTLWASKAAATSAVQRTHASAKPLPMGFPHVTMSGTAPGDCSKPQKVLPSRPNPTCRWQGWRVAVKRYKRHDI